jgi:dTDP-4-amino-4,6-dideoxygalactose transaminase
MEKRTVKLLDLTQQYTPLREEIRKVIDQVCDSQSLILGKTVETFENQLAEYCQCKYALGVSSGTDAILCALMALDIKPGDEVICPSFTFFATAGCVARLGAVPVFADIQPDTFNIDPRDIESRITQRTKAILPVHLYGQMADMEAINQIAKKHDLAVIEDACQAIGSVRNGHKACSMGTIGTLSFYPTKNLGAFGDAGAMTTNDPALQEKFKLLRVHGSGHQYFHKFVGGNFRIDAIQAAILSVKFKYLDQWQKGREKHAALYNELLADSAVITPKIANGNQSVYNQYVIRVDNRDAVKQKLADAGVGSGIYYPLPLHQQECFNYLGIRPGSLPETEKACQEVLALPIYPELKEEEIRYVAEKVIEAVGE